MSERAYRTTEALVASLVGDLAPVRPVRAGRMVAAAFLVEVAAVLVTAWMLGAHAAGMERVSDPAFAALLGALAAGAAASAAAMTRLAIPGSAVSPVWRAAVLALPLVVAALLAAFSPWGGTWKGFFAVVFEGFGCTKTTLLVAAPAWIAGLLFLRRLAPLDPLRVGLFSASSALLTAALVVQMACANCDSWHMAISHYVPILLAAWIGAMLSPLVLGGSRR
jgi:hypothetical protein